MVVAESEMNGFDNAMMIESENVVVVVVQSNSSRAGLDGSRARFEINSLQTAGNSIIRTPSEPSRVGFSSDHWKLSRQIAADLLPSQSSK